MERRNNDARNKTGRYGRMVRRSDSRLAAAHFPSPSRGIRAGRQAGPRGLRVETQRERERERERERRQRR